MQRTDDQLMTVGELARRTGLSIRLLSGGEPVAPEQLGWEGR
jgi:hypothetical protein